MKVVFDHMEGFGKVSMMDFIYSCPHGMIEAGDRESDLLAQGWIPWDGVWYNIRSVRIDIERYKPSKTTRRLGKQTHCVVENAGVIKDQHRYMDIYHTYCRHHGFERTITWEQIFQGTIMSYFKEGELIGYSCVEFRDGQMVATQFVWDYAEPKLSLGKVAQMYEVILGKNQGCRYVYILGGYEKCCLYKGDFEGMEYWLGDKWHTDKQLYRELCLRDEAIQIIPA